MPVLDRASQPGTTEDYQHKSWPAWRYGPEGKSEIFEREDDVPDGWEDHPEKVGGKKAERQQRPAPTESKYKDFTDAKIVEELKTRKLEFGDKWPRNKLEGLLLEDDKKKAS